MQLEIKVILLSRQNDSQNEASVHLHRTHKELQREGETGGCGAHWQLSGSTALLCCCLSAAACCVSVLLYFSLHTFGRQLKTVWQRRRHSVLFLWRHTKYAAVLVKCAKLKGITGTHTHSIHTHTYIFN